MRLERVIIQQIGEFIALHLRVPEKFDFLSPGDMGFRLRLFFNAVEPIGHGRPTG
jgi:hypothetical protein